MAARPGETSLFVEYPHWKCTWTVNRVYHALCLGTVSHSTWPRDSSWMIFLALTRQSAAIQLKQRFASTTTTANTTRPRICDLLKTCFHWTKQNVAPARVRGGPTTRPTCSLRRMSRSDGIKGGNGMEIGSGSEQTQLNLSES
jgi:hypothetical protein